MILSLDASQVAKNIKDVLLFLRLTDGRKWTQADFASLCGVHPVTVNSWARGRDISRSSCMVVAAALEKHFAAEGLRLTSDDVSGPGLVERMREQLADYVAVQSRPLIQAIPATLQKIIDDAGVVRLLGIDGALRAWLVAMVPSMRPDLTDQDWAEVVRIVKAGRWNEEGWLFMDPEVVSVNMHFKIPKGKTVTDEERRKLRGILQKELDRLWGEKQKPE